VKFSLVFLLTAIILIFFNISNIYTNVTSSLSSEDEQSAINDVIVGGEDLILEIQGDDNPEILQFQIPSTNYSQVCPSNECNIEITHTFLSGATPDDDSPTISVSIDFYLHDDITNANLTPAQKLFIEKFQFHLFCRISNIDEIVQDKEGNVVYHCAGNDSLGGASIAPKESSSNLPSLYYSYNLSYDTKTETLKLNGKLDRVRY
jgi:hypothetical protein